jgi:hypothetical protein
MQSSRRLCAAAVLVLGVSAPAICQPIVPPPAEEIDLSGPRVGFTVLPQTIVDTLKIERHIAVAPLISQFGWQFEKQFYSAHSGPTAITEGVLLLGGLDQGVAIPSVSWLVGVRTRDGAEFGVGPNITPAGVALAIAAGMTFRAGTLNVPLNVAVVPSKSGTRVSVLTGFSIRRR